MTNTNFEMRKMLARFGLEPRRSVGRVVRDGAALVGLGVAVGAGAALLMPPARLRSLWTGFRARGEVPAQLPESPAVQGGEAHPVAT
jgi:hypothetical protein